MDRYAIAAKKFSGTWDMVYGCLCLMIEKAFLTANTHKSLIERTK